MNLLKIGTLTAQQNDKAQQTSNNWKIGDGILILLTCGWNIKLNMYVYEFY